MEALPAVAPDKLIALMIAGAVFSLAGLWLLFRSAKEGEAAKIELLGLKFQSSSAGLLVFLVGAVFFVGGIVLPEKHGPMLPVPSPTTAEDDDGGEGGGAVVAIPPGTAGKAITLPRGPGAKEVEPNNFLTNANQLNLGEFASGKLDPENRDIEDWYVAAPPGGPDDKFRVQIRTRKRDYWAACFVTIYDHLETQVASKEFSAEGGSIHIEGFIDKADFLLIRLKKFKNQFDANKILPCEYEVKFEIAE